MGGCIIEVSGTKPLVDGPNGLYIVTILPEFARKDLIDYKILQQNKVIGVAKAAKHFETFSLLKLTTDVTISGEKVGVASDIAPLIFINNTVRDIYSYRFMPPQKPVRRNNLYYLSTPDVQSGLPVFINDGVGGRQVVGCVIGDHKSGGAVVKPFDDELFEWLDNIDKKQLVILNGTIEPEEPN